jgi:hypothetical protein
LARTHPNDVREHPVTKTLADFIASLPGVEWVSSDCEGEGNEQWWWVKFKLDLRHACSWLVIQQVAHVANNLSVSRKLPIVFYPTSPPVYLNGGPEQHLYWVIEVIRPPFDPSEVIRQAKPYFPDDPTSPTEWARLARATQRE